MAGVRPTMGSRTWNQQLRPAVQGQRLPGGSRRELSSFQELMLVVKSCRLQSELPGPAEDLSRTRRVVVSHIFIF